jgi:hypothetical protein
MLKPAVHNGPQDLRLQQEVSEAGAVYGDVVALDALLLGLYAIFLGAGVSLLKNTPPPPGDIVRARFVWKKIKKRVGGLKFIKKKEESEQENEKQHPKYMHTKKR